MEDLRTQKPNGVISFFVGNPAVGRILITLIAERLSLSSGVLELAMIRAWFWLKANA